MTDYLYFKEGNTFTDIPILCYKMDGQVFFIIQGVITNEFLTIHSQGEEWNYIIPEEKRNFLFFKERGGFIFVSEDDFNDEDAFLRLTVEKTEIQDSSAFAIEMKNARLVASFDEAFTISAYESAFGGSSVLLSISQELVALPKLLFMLASVFAPNIKIFITSMALINFHSLCRGFMPLVRQRLIFRGIKKLLCHIHSNPTSAHIKNLFICER